MRGPIFEIFRKQQKLLLGVVNAFPIKIVLKNERDRDIYEFLKKIAYLYSSIAHLETGTPINDHEKVFDFYSVVTLTRSAFETFLIFHFIFLQPESDEEIEFRYKAWSRDGMVITSQADFDDEDFQERKEQNEKKMLHIEKELKQSRFFNSLAPKQKKCFFRPGGWQTKTFSLLAKEILILPALSIAYGFLSSFAHPSKYGFIVARQMKTFEKQEQSLSYTFLILVDITREFLSELGKFFPGVNELYLNSDWKEIEKLIMEYPIKS